MLTRTETILDVIGCGGSAPLMVHIADDDDIHGICGVVLKYPDVELPDDGPIDCVVCEDIWQSWDVE